MGAIKKTSTYQLMQQVIGTEEDFEFYPTTDAIIETIKLDMAKSRSFDQVSMLDCGAGDGRVLEALTKGRKYAIEKSRPLLNALDKNIFVVGTDFEQQSLLDKKVTYIFSNPPYSTYAEWAEKIIREGNAKCIYLVIPTRWKNNTKIIDALKLRDTEAEVLGSFDFLEADRKARAKIDILKIDLCFKSSHCSASQKTDPFKLWFDEHFKIQISNTSPSKHNLKEQIKSSLSEGFDSNNQLVQGSDIVSILEQMYQRDLEKLLKTYQGLSDVDPVILGELDVNLVGVQSALEMKVVGLKDLYWEELFTNLHKVTDRLTVKSRKTLLETLTKHTHVDFTVSNAHAVLGWVVKQSNNYFDDQLIETVERMTQQDNVLLYKSNTKTFAKDEWRYTYRPESLDKYSLDYRIVASRIGGLANPDSWYREKGTNGLSDGGCEHVNDLCTIASNIGFDTTGLQRANSFQWESNKKHTFQYRDITTKQLFTLFEVRAFKNGNLHYRFNQKFMCKLNIELGRLKGWLRSPKEAVDELDIPLEIAEQSFNSNLQLTSNALLSLGLS